MELVLPFSIGLSFRVRADGGVGNEGEERSGAWPMAALELTPPDVSAAVETDVTQLGSEASPSASGEGREPGGVPATSVRREGVRGRVSARPRGLPLLSRP